MPPTNPKYKECHLEVPCGLDANPNQFKGDGDYCRYKKTELGCCGNPKVTRPDKCHHLIQFVNIGIVDPKYLDQEKG